MDTHTHAAAETHVFNPQQWLDEFKHCGGYWLVIGDRLATIGVWLDGNIEHEQRAGAALTTLRSNPDQLAAVRAHLTSEEGRP